MQVMREHRQERQEESAAERQHVENMQRMNLEVILQSQSRFLETINHLASGLKTTTNKMKLYKLINPKSTGYDDYDAMIVCAESADEAKALHPFSLDGAKTSADYFRYDDEFWKNPSWCKLKEVIVEEIGEANSFIQKGVVLASFKAAYDN